MRAPLLLSLLLLCLGAPPAAADDLEEAFRAFAEDRLARAQEAVQNPDKYAEVIQIAKQLAQESLQGVRTLLSDNTVNDALLAATTLSHQTTINANVSDSAKIEAVDPNEVAAKLQAVELQLQASFGAYSQTIKLSLVNFIA